MTSNNGGMKIKPIVFIYVTNKPTKAWTSTVCTFVFYTKLWLLGNMNFNFMLDLAKKNYTFTNIIFVQHMPKQLSP